MLDFPRCQHCDTGYPESALVEHERHCQPAPSSVGSVVSKEDRTIRSPNDVPVFLAEVRQGVCEHEIPNRIQLALMEYLYEDAIQHKSIYRFAGREHLAKALTVRLGEAVSPQQIQRALNALEADGIWFKTMRGPALKTLLRKDRHLARSHRRVGCPRILRLNVLASLGQCEECNGYVAQGIDEIERVANGGL